MAQRGFEAPFLTFFQQVEGTQTACGTAMQRGARVIVADVTQDPVFVGKPSLAVMLAAGVRAVQATPLISHTGQLLGMFSTHYAVPHQPSDRALRFLDLLAHLAAEALEHAQMDARLRAATTEAEQRARAAEEAEAALRHAIAERQCLEREAQRTAPFAVLGRVAAGVSHEIRNPLGAIVLHVDLLEEELRAPRPDSNREVQAALAEIKMQLVRLDDLVQDYLTLVRGASAQWEVQDLGAAVHAWGRELDAVARPRGATVVLAGLEHLGQTAFHANTLRRAVLNLVQNALDAMPQGGTITLAGSRTAQAVQLQVRDTGSGIPPEHLEQIFEPLYTTKRGGTGLGLYIVHEIVAAHGGQITVESILGQGTVFTLTFPTPQGAEGASR